MNALQETRASARSIPAQAAVQEPAAQRSQAHLPEAGAQPRDQSEVPEPAAQPRDQARFGENKRTEPAQIDVAEVLEAFSGAPTTDRPVDLFANPRVRRIPGQGDCISVGPCPVCGDTEAQPLYEIDACDSRLVVCRDCGLGRLWPLPTPRQIARFYAPEYYGASGAKFRPLVERTVRAIAAARARRSVAGLPRGARVLDVGCGRGVLLGALADCGCEVHGFEISPTAATGADPRAEIRIADELAAAHYPSNFFDQVLLWHVLEHLPNPRQTLVEIRRILRPGGRLIVSVPNFASWQARWSDANWFHLDLPRHLHHFPLPALTRLLETCGLDAEHVRHFALDQNVFGWVQGLLNRCSSSPNRLYGLLKNGAHRPDAHRAARFWREIAAGALLAPAALLLSMIEVVAGRGGTVTVTATKRREMRAARERTAAGAWTRLLGQPAAMGS